MATLLSSSRDNRILRTPRLSRKMVSVFTVSLKKSPVNPLNGLHWWICLVFLVLVHASGAGPATAAVEFPGPMEQSLLAAPLSAISVPWDDGNSEFLIVGDDNGFLNLVYHLFQDIHFGVFYRYPLGGEVVWVGPWEGSPYGQRGFVVATANPDRLHFIEINYSEPYFRVEQTLELSEDPGVADFIAPGPEGQPQLVLSLPGVDQVLVLRQQAGLWSINQVLATGDEPWFLTAIDLDGDQVLEFITADRGELSGTLGIFSQLPDGSYFLQSHAELPGRVHQIQAEDFDLDGLQELVVSYTGLSRLDIMTGETGSFVTHHSLNTTLPPDYFQIFTLPQGDFSLVSCTESRGMMDFFHFEAETWIHKDSYYVGCQPQSLAPCDLNGDGIKEIVCLGYSENILSILLGNTLPGFWGYPAAPLPANPGSSLLADLDGNGFSDLVVSTMSPNLINLYLRQPGGELAKTPISQESGFFPVSLAAGDFLGDQTNELVALDLSGGELVLMTYEGIDGFVTHSTVPFSSSYSQLKVADIDHDGHEDIYLAQANRQQVDVLFGQGEGAFAPVLSLDLPLGAYDVAALDLNQDSNLDLVVTDGLSRVWTLLNLDGRSFGSPVHTQAGSGARSIEVADLDGDTDQDIVVANFNSNSITVLENIGDGTLGRRIGGLSLSGQPNSIQCGDMNDDGVPDVVIHLAGNNGMLVVEAEGVWGYFHYREYQTSGSVFNSQVEDFNMDGRPDILNLDNDLLLGMIMFNTELALVSVDPAALTLDCNTDEFRIRILPDRQGPWELFLGKPGSWQMLAANGQSQVGSIDFDGRGWVLEFTSEDVGYLDESVQLRLTVGGMDQQESLELALFSHCFSAAPGLPELRWRDLPWPNPFNPRMHGRIQLDAPSRVDAAVFDLSGRRVATLLQGNLPAGVHDLTWDGKNQGQAAAAGLYLLRISSENSLLSRKIVLLK
jgi:hypothetical protein